MAFVRAAEHFHPYLYGNHFEIRTDHSSLQWLLNFKNPEGQMARWLQNLKLQQYDFKIEHRLGKLHGNADALSRRPYGKCGCSYCEMKEVNDRRAKETTTEQCMVGAIGNLIRTVTAENSSNAPDLQHIEQAQLSDPEIQPILTSMKESAVKPPWEEVSSYNTAVKTYWGQWESLRCHEGRLYRCLDNASTQEMHWQLVVPKSLRRTVLEQLH